MKYLYNFFKRRLHSVLSPTNQYASVSHIVQRIA